MAEIKSLSDIRGKWSRVTSMRGEDYKLGVESPRRDWADETEAAAGNWKTGIDKAAAGKLFEKGVRKAGTSKWRDNAIKKGPGRFMEGVLLAEGDYAEGFAPYHAAIERVDLGPRYPRRDPRNLNRVKAVVDALITEKLK